MENRTPLYNFVREYQNKKMARLHMPGHKGVPALGCEPWDITEISGADVLSKASGVILESEKNTAALFGTRHSFYSTGGSSQCIGAMLALVRKTRGKGRLLAARNVHRAFINACALLDLEADWLYPQEQASYCACPVTPGQLEKALSQGEPPLALYVTSPDYLGGMQNIEGLSRVCRCFGVPLLVDNAHGAYLRFLTPSLHPMDLGADLCCDSAHKTLPALTGGAYLHVAKNARLPLWEEAREALALFGSTSPSYLILQSLDLCVPYLEGNYPQRLAECAARISELRLLLGRKGYASPGKEPLKLTVEAKGKGRALARIFRAFGVEGEFADRDYFVLMATPENKREDFERVKNAIESLPSLQSGAALPAPPPLLPPPRACSIRHAMLGPCLALPLEKALGRVCAQPDLSCPPAVPIIIPGEKITKEAAALLNYYGINSVRVMGE